MRLVFAIIYLAVDIIYVLGARNVYFDMVKGIQYKDTKLNMTHALAAIGAYVLLALGWVVLVATRIEGSKRPVTDGMYFGFVYGLVVYGVFNLTNYVMFQNYKTTVLIQDMLWGTTCATILSLAYGKYIGLTRRS